MGRKFSFSAATCAVALALAGLSSGVAFAEDEEDINLYEDPVTGITMVEADPGSEVIVDETGTVVEIIPPYETDHGSYTSGEVKKILELG